ncbi:MAG TPA: Gldg family protein, partial [Aggregatilineales bacterium]|nr:Gldg family protein [Aggregatilineales bacterium]
YTPDTLPNDLKDAPDTVQTVADKITGTSSDKFIYEAVNVDDPANNVDKQALFDGYGIQPFATDFFATETFYLHLVLNAGGKSQVIYLSGDVSESEVEDSIEAALQRSSTGFLKVVGIWTPPDIPTQNAFGQAVPSLQAFRTVSQSLREDYEVQLTDLSAGEVPANLDILLVIAPQNMTDIERYAIDQYLMRGGTVMVAAGSYQISQDQFTGGLGLIPIENGLKEMLASYGVNIEESLVVDQRNAPFPTQVTRNVGGMTVQEIQAMDYPFFVDVRQDGFDKDNPVFSRLPSLTLSWASPVNVDKDKTAGATVSTLMQSSRDAWITTSTNPQPDMNLYPDFGFPRQGDAQVYPLAVVVQGTFESFFQDKEPPFTAPPETDTQTGEEPVTPPAAAPLESSAQSARLIVVGSSEFLNDNVIQLGSQFSAESALNALQFVQNTVDWVTEDTDLLSIRSRGSSSRLLDPLTEDKQNFWEGLNYGLALISLIVLGVLWQWRKRTEKPIPLIGGDSPQNIGQELQGGVL